MARLGRPRTTGRTEKFTLYMTPEHMDNLKLLAAAYGMDVTELLNNLISKLCKEQDNALVVLKTQREQFRHMFTLNKQEDTNNGD